MATLHELVSQSKAQSKERLTFVKSASELHISAEADLRSSEFHLLKIAVCKFPLIFAAGASEDGDLVLDFNFDRLGRSQSGYIPKVIVLSGINAAREAKRIMHEKGVKNTTAWLGARAFRPMEVTASDACVNNFQSLLTTELNRNTKSRSLVVDVYPFENYAIINKDGIKHRQRFSFDASENRLDLEGASIPIASIQAEMPLALVDGANSGTTQGGFDGRQFNVADAWRDFGAPGSEANTPALKLMLNVEEALRCYLTEILKGVWKVMYPGTAVTPPNMIHASIEANIAAREAKAKNFSVVDFLKWQNKKLNIKACEQFKIVNGDQYYPEDFGYIGEVRDISTWFVPMRTQSEMKAAARKEKFAGVPRFAQKGVRRKVEAAGNPSSGKPTKNNPHKFVMDADKTDMCKQCSRSSAHPIHKVK